MSEDPSPTKRYLGDGVYVDLHPLGLLLTTEDGISVTNEIVLEPQVYRALLDYVEQMKKQRRTHK